MFYKKFQISAGCTVEYGLLNKLLANQSMCTVWEIYNHHDHQSNFDWGWPDLRHFVSNLSNSHSPSCSIHGVLFLQTNALALLLHKFASSTSSLVVLASSCPSLRTPTRFSEHAHHPSSSHAHTISLHLALPSEPLFPSIPTSPPGPLSSFCSSLLHHTLLSPLLSQSFSKLLSHFPSDTSLP